MDKFVKLAVMVAVLLAGIGVFYHYVIFLPGVERDKATTALRVSDEKVMSEQVARAITESRENRRRLTYDACVLDARSNYEANWRAACITIAESNASRLNNCLNDKRIMGNQFMGAEYCKKTYANRDASPTCPLPDYNANSVNAFHKQAQEKCVTEARLGLQ